MAALRPLRLVGAATALVGLAWVASRVGPETWFGIGLLRYGPPWLPLTPWLLAGAVLARRKAWRALAATVGLVLLGLGATLPWRVPPSPNEASTGNEPSTSEVTTSAALTSDATHASDAARASQPTWTLFAWNLEKYDHGASAIVGVLARVHADVSCFTEAGRYFWHQERDQTPAPLDEALADATRVASGELRV